MPDYVKWVKSLPGKPVFVAYPAGYDFTFMYWYMIRFAGESPFSHSALDIKTFAMAMLRKGYRDSTKRNMPVRWFDPSPHTHVALDDAIEQGKLFCNMLEENNKSRVSVLSSSTAADISSSSTIPSPTSSGRPLSQIRVPNFSLCCARHCAITFTRQ